jgi:hypothetical protein
MLSLKCLVHNKTAADKSRPETKKENKAGDTYLTVRQIALDIGENTIASSLTLLQVKRNKTQILLSLLISVDGPGFIPSPLL